jgi:hypothetical protein
MTPNWMDMISNPKGMLINNYMLQILGQEKFLKHKAFIERLGSSLPTTSDVQELGAIVVAIYENGYYKALNDYREQFQKLGYDVNVKRETVAGNQK